MHPRFAWNLCETKHFSGEFTNGSSADATGSNWRFQAENLRQITIYQLMKPLKIIPPSSCAHCLRRCITYECRLRSEEQLWRESRSQRALSCYYIRRAEPNWGPTEPELLPSVEWTWANVMRNQQRVCSIRREPAMVPGSMRRIRDMTEEVLVKEVRVGRRQRCSSLDLITCGGRATDVWVREEMSSCANVTNL